ncbi:MAG: cell division protein FtsQ/DivIB [Cyclobacteriaceae bacterium]|jgi:cell division protein FtsQ|nr:cell division protein FtsQ [Cytophagales bacterium]HNP76851.1 cell division protein FtsQ/DivIB [Cyclobacteriaceae bacterium]HQQ83846.1 cell division protein FtsQ/DivIB [Cyclobacteriaceae bacterium]
MKLKLNIRKEIKIAAALVGVTFLIAFTERKQGGSLCNNVVVELDNLNENHFLDERDVMRLVENSGQTIKGTSITRINLKAIESKLMMDKHIRDAELYGDLKGNLIVSVDLRRPIARLVQEDGPDAYLSEEGIVMGVSDKFTSRVMIISGRWAKAVMEKGNVYEMEGGKELMDMIDFINEDRFWKAQIAQMDIDARGEMVIYPQVTGQRVEFGTTENYETKLSNLMVFYKDVLPQKGWTRYERVNLKYNGQVIAQ